MFFVLSKLLIFLISPSFWILLFLVWSFLTKKEKRRKAFRITAVVLFIVFTNPFLFNFLLTRWQPKAVSIPAGQKYSAAILLGGMTMLDKNGKSYFGPDADRFIQAVKLYHTGTVQYIAVTGGSPALFSKRKPEAEQIKTELMNQGVPENAIITETMARNTFENASFIKKKLDSLQVPSPYILVTSAMHVPRARAVFKKAGIDVVPYPAAFKEVDSEYNVGDFIIPSVSLLSSWSAFLKEVVGYTVYKMTKRA